MGKLTKRSTLKAPNFPWVKMLKIDGQENEVLGSGSFFTFNGLIPHTCTFGRLAF